MTADELIVVLEEEIETLRQAHRLEEDGFKCAVYIILIHHMRSLIDKVKGKALHHDAL